MVAGTLRVYGSEISYYTGKLEAYLRYKEIPYERVAMTSHLFRVTVPRATGAAQMPAVELPDGRWMTDTTPIIDWFETHVAGAAGDPARSGAGLREPPAGGLRRRMAVAARDALPLELRGRRAAARAPHRRRGAGRTCRCRGALQALRDPPPPAPPLSCAATASRPRTRTHVEGVYLRSARRSCRRSSRARPFLLGERPTLADFGFFASMFRHFASRPDARGDHARARAGGLRVGARGCGTRADRRRTRGELVAGIPRRLGPAARRRRRRRISRTSCANAEAWKARSSAASTSRSRATRLPARCRRRATASGVSSACARTSSALPAAAREAVATLCSTRHGCWEPLWRVDTPSSGHDPEHRAPFGRGIPVFE